MASIVRVTLAVAEHWGSPGVYSVEVSERLGSASPRLIARQLVGSRVSEADIAVGVQIVEDAFAAALHRTLGVQRQLVY